MPTSRLPSSIAASPSPFRVRPLSELDLEPPGSPNSGLFPTVEAKPASRELTGQGLRRAVLMFVVLGVVALLAYASWARLAHGRTPAAVERASR